MTREGILEMEPGPELNTLVAERVMGWETEALSNTKINYIDDRGLFTYKVQDWNPGEDIYDAWVVLDRLRDEPHSIRRTFTHEMTRFMNPNQSPAVEQIHWSNLIWYINPERICKAALIAVMYEK